MLTEQPPPKAGMFGETVGQSLLYRVNPDMISKDDHSPEDRSSHHNRSNIGSVRMVRVGSRSFPLYPLVLAALGLLNGVLLLAAITLGISCGNISDEYAPHDMKAQELIVQLKQLQTMRLEAIKERDETLQTIQKALTNHNALTRQLKQNKTFVDHIQKHVEELQSKRASLQSSTSEIRDSCGRCPPDWVLLNTSCYFHSKSEKTWMDSRADCVQRGGHLAVIDTSEEQVNLFEFMPKLRPMWIGLNDIQTEGTWVWVNNVTLRENGYWINGQLNIHEEEHCVASLNRKDPASTWFRLNCAAQREWICEMQPTTNLSPH